MTLKRLSPQDLPAGVRTDGTSLPNGGKIYTFSHNRLGLLGRLVLTPYDGTQTHIAAELAPGDPDDPEWEERYRLLDQVVTICVKALPGGKETDALSSMEEVRRERQMFRRFIEAAHSIEMFRLVKSLSEEEYTILLGVIDRTLITADPVDAVGIRQRREELCFYWQDLQERPEI